jgi:hypothetical protein
LEQIQRIDHVAFRERRGGRFLRKDERIGESVSNRGQVTNTQIQS